MPRLMRSGVLAKGSADYQALCVYRAHFRRGARTDPQDRRAVCARHMACPPAPRRCNSRCANPRVTSTICGVTKPERIRQTLEWASFRRARRVLDRTHGAAVRHRRSGSDARLQARMILDELISPTRSAPFVDYPKPGILFRDITTLLGNARAFPPRGG